MGDKVIKRWKRGLWALPAIYIIALLGCIGLQVIKYQTYSFDLKMAQFLEADRKVEGLELEALKKSNTQLDQFLIEMEGIRDRALLLAGIMTIAVLVFCRSLWLITTAPRSAMERYTRYGIFTLPVLFLGRLLEPEKWEFLSLLAFMLLFVGQQHAVMKICQTTEQFDEANRFNFAYWICVWAMVVAVIGGMILDALNLQETFLQALSAILTVGVSVGVVLKSISTWKIHRHLVRMGI